MKCVLEPFFAKNVCNVLIETFFACFRQFYYLTQNYHFEEAILPIFKIVSFHEYEVFFGAVFCIEGL